MGYSCTRDAGDTLETIENFCREQNGSSNTWTTPAGRFFFEIGRENRDGAITGKVMRSLADGTCRNAGGFRIEPDGMVTRFPHLPAPVPLLKGGSAMRSKDNMPEFTATQWNTAADKQRFAKQFQKFVSGGFQRADFPKTFYQRLSNTFGHIAHYNQDGFYSTFFEDPAGKVAFVKQCLQYEYSGDPTFTYGDVEKYLRVWLVSSGVLEKVCDDYRAAVEAAERAEYARLKNKFEERT